MTKMVFTLKDALKTILNYTEKKEPKTMAEAEGMLAVINVIAGATLLETAEEEAKSA
jgi:hypothetical protein